MFMCVGEFVDLTRPILALNCRLQLELVMVMGSADGPLVLALLSLRFARSFSFTDSLSFLESCSFVDETSPL